MRSAATLVIENKSAKKQIKAVELIVRQIMNGRSSSAYPFGLPRDPVRGEIRLLHEVFKGKPKFPIKNTTCESRSAYTRSVGAQG